MSSRGHHHRQPEVGRTAGLELPGSLSALNVAARQWLDAVANVRLHGKTPQLPIHPTHRIGLLDLDLIPYDLP